VLLTLLRDTAWFVRLHAVRALAQRRFLPQAGEIRQSLSDPNWRVREASVATLRTFGAAGFNQLIEHFISTEDTYSREQVADELQRGGLIPDVLRRYGEDGDWRAAQVLDQMVRMGKTAYVLGFLSKEAQPPVRKKFLVKYVKDPDPQIRQWVARLATSEPDSEIRGLAMAALESRSPAAER
jgi:hypothetical protein